MGLVISSALVKNSISVFTSQQAMTRVSRPPIVASECVRALTYPLVPVMPFSLLTTDHRPVLLYGCSISMAAVSPPCAHVAIARTGITMHTLPSQRQAGDQFWPRAAVQPSSLCSRAPPQCPHAPQEAGPARGPHTPGNSGPVSNPLTIRG